MIHAIKNYIMKFLTNNFLIIYLKTKIKINLQSTHKNEIVLKIKDTYILTIKSDPK